MERLEMAEPLSTKATSCLWTDLKQNPWHKETAVRSQFSSPSPLSSDQGKLTSPYSLSGQTEWISKPAAAFSLHLPCICKPSLTRDSRSSF